VTEHPQEQLLDIRPDGRYDKVAAAYDGLSDVNKATFREAIQAPVEVHGHESIARALRTLGYDVDRKQVHLFREKLSRGKVSL
jgi:hypothetical protein